MTISDAELNEIEKACAEATEGPWSLSQNPWKSAFEVQAFSTSETFVVPDDYYGIGEFVFETNGRFAVGARAWVPALLDEVKRLREENRKLQVEVIDWEARVRSEREACAMVVEDEAKRLSAGDHRGFNESAVQAIAVALEKRAAAIRARGTR